jgi:hypothetical protein
MPQMHLRRRLSWFGLACLLLIGLAQAEKPQVIQSPHYRVYFEKKHEAVATEVLQVAERVWPFYAKAYDAYDHYQTIDIFLVDPGDYANGNAIYTFSRVEIYVSHLNWVMRGRSNWIGNVVAHELAHVFTLRRAAKLSAFDDVLLQAYTFNRAVNWSFSTYFIPLVAPTWYVEGIAQFESEAMGYDLWDSQRDMIVRDAYLTKTLPSLAEIETFDGDWVQAERAYNTGFAFLRYLRERFGIEKVRRLAFPKPFFHFGYAVEATFGKPLPVLYQDWQKSLADVYGAYKEKPKDPLADFRIQGSFSQNLAFSPNGQYMAWLGNGDRQYAINWIYWLDIQKGTQGKSAQPTQTQSAAPTQAAPHSHGETPRSRGLNGRDFMPWKRPDPSPAPSLRRNLLQNTAESKAEGFTEHQQRSSEFGSSGLEFNAKGNRLLTTRQDMYAAYTDIWEYEFLSAKPEDEKWHRLTWNVRASYPSYHPKFSKTILFVQLFEGSSNLAVLDSSGQIHRLTRFRNGEQCYNPRFTPAGDSIVFTLGRGEHEAIVKISAAAKAYDEFEALRDSSDFADTLSLAKGEKVAFVTAFEKAGIRDLRYQGDTLLFSSNRKSGVYEAYALVPKDTTLYLLTQARTQALEPLIFQGHLYYQGYEKQQFRLFRRPLGMTPVEKWTLPNDSLPTVKPKTKPLSKVFESAEPSIRNVAWGIEPTLTLAPSFLDDTTLSAINVELGLNLAIGPMSGGISQAMEGFLSKRMDFNTPVDYGGTYSGAMSFPGAWHTRFYWQPNIQYSLSHIQQAHVSNFHEEFANPNVGIDSVWIENSVKVNETYYTDMLFYSSDLPFSGLKSGPGYWQFGSYGRWYRRTTDVEVHQNVSQTPFQQGPTGRVYSTPFAPFSQSWTYYRDAQLHRHFLTATYGQWVTQAVGTALPQFFAVYGSAAKWWTRYAQTDLSVDANLAGEFTKDREPFGESLPIQGTFNPWQLDLGWTGALSKGENFLAYLSMDVGTFTEKFPQNRDAAHLTSNGVGFDTTFASNPDPNLWVMTYRLGLDRMPAYPYNFTYRGDDILSGTALLHTRLEVDIPIKIRKYIDYPSLFSSLNQVQLSLIGDAGLTLDRSPDRLVGMLERGEHHLLTDYGARISGTFFMYHQIPMTVFAQVFMPYNELKASKLYNLDYPRATPIAGPGSNAAQDRHDRDQYMKLVKNPRYFVGLTVGIF